MIKDLHIPWERYALIVELAQRIQHLQTKRPQFGKTALQKLIYFLQEVYDVKCGYNFSLYTYGPFTSQVLQDLDLVESIGGVEVTSFPTDLGGYRIVPGKNAPAITKKEAGFLAQHEEKLNNLVEDYGTFSAKELELRATIVYVARDMRRDGKRVSVDALTQMVHDIKLYFPREEIRSVVEELQAMEHVNGGKLMENRQTGRYASLAINVPMPPPHWALLERELLRAQEAACAAFYAKYFDDRGYLVCIPRWGGNDGPDDAGENLLNWPMLHALGASDSVLALYKQGWNGHLRQYTEAKTKYVPMAREGMYYKEFSVMFDWMHHGEWISPFILEPLSNPADHTYEQRIRRYAGFYMDEDPQALNYDPEQNLIRSMFNGSRGPMLRKSTALDWAGDPIEVAGRFDAKHGENSFAQMLDHFRDYNDVAGDHPLNLATTTVALTAYALTGEAKYRDWIVRYVDGWVAHTKANNGIIPTNIGLDGTIGGACDGKWYGGVYGWGFSVVDHNTGKLAHRPAFQQRAVYGFGNALLLTGDQSYLAVWREMLNAVNANEKIVDGKSTYPHMYGDAYGDEGWYDYRPEPFAPGAHELYYLSMDQQDLARAPHDPWYDFLAGKNPGYPVEALQRDYATVRHRSEQVRLDVTTADTRLSDDMNAFNPAITDALIRLTLGGFPTGREGGPLYCRLRYFDPARRRAGLPEDVAALVDHLTASEVGVELVNLNPVEERTLIVQGGAYAEHQFISATAEGITTEVNGPHLVVCLAPGAGERITLTMQRYANQPTLRFPWV